MKNNKHSLPSPGRGRVLLITKRRKNRDPFPSRGSKKEARLSLKQQSMETGPPLGGGEGRKDSLSLLWEGKGDGSYYLRRKKSYGNKRGGKNGVLRVVLSFCVSAKGGGKLEATSLIDRLSVKREGVLHLSQGGERGGGTRYFLLYSWFSGVGINAGCPSYHIHSSG